MFGFGKNNKYESIFSSEDSVHKHIYGDRNKTVNILGDPGFIDAWLKSSNNRTVTTVIASEAENGDIPSIKQMVWLYQVIFAKAEDQMADKSARLGLQVVCLQNRIQMCEKGEEFGENYSYCIMSSAINLHTLYMRNKGLGTNEEITKSLNLAVKNAREVLNQENLASELYDDPQGVLEDSRNILEQHGATSAIFSQVFSNN